MMTSTTTRSRSESTTTAKSIAAVLDNVLGDATAFIIQGILSRERAAKWKSDLAAVLAVGAVKHFQLQLTLPDGSRPGFDYEVSDDGTITGGDACGGFSSHHIPSNASITIVLGWRENAPRLAEAKEILKERGWTNTGALLAASPSVTRVFASDGFGVNRRDIGNWPL